MPKIHVNNINMYYEVHGEGEPLVFVPGFSADHMMWLPVLNDFAKHYQVILFDNRGAGQTDVPTGPYTIEQMASDVIELCKQLGIEKAHFIGSSMGGYITQMIAYHYPEFVKSVVICNSALATNVVFGYYLKAQLELMKSNAPREWISRASCTWAFSHQFLSKPGQYDQLIQAGLNNPYPFTIEGYEAQYAALEKFDSRPWINNIKAPVLVLASDQDIIFSEATTKMIATEIKHAEYYCFKECGHLPNIEYSKEYIEIVTRFLDKQQ